VEPTFGEYELFVIRTLQSVLVYDSTPTSQAITSPDASSSIVYDKGKSIAI